MQIAFNKLSVSAENPRTTKAATAQHDALVASIKSHGLIQPLVVRPHANNNGRYEVVDGSRRFAALKEIGLETVECVVNLNEHSIAEIGTAANMMRAAMHPLDEATVIARLFADGESAEAVGLRFGQTTKWVDQRVKLEGLSKSVKNLFRAGNIDIEAAQAFTLGTKPEQDAYVKAAKNTWQMEADTIHRHFSNAKVNAKHAIFDLALYPDKAVIRDLFGEDVYLSDREKFMELQTVAIEALVEKLRAEGWSDVLTFMSGPDYTIANKYVRVDGSIKKADRSKYVSMVVFDPRSGAVSSDRGFVLRKNADKVKVGAAPADDAVDDADVKPLDYFDLNKSQVEIAGALLTSGLERAIAGGDTYLALKTLLQPQLAYGKSSKECPAWARSGSSGANYLGINLMMTDKIESPEVKETSFPSRKVFDALPWDKVMELVCDAAVHLVQTLPHPDEGAVSELKATGTEWFRFDEGFLKRYRLDALQSLAKKLKVPFEDVKKKDLVAAILASDQKLIPLK